MWARTAKEIKGDHAHPDGVKLALLVTWRSRANHDYSAVSWRMLRELGVFGPAAPAALAELRTTRQRTPAELIGRYQLACQPVRDLLVDYLQERQPGLDYTSL